MFRANATLRTPALIGHETFVSGSKEKIETATLREVTLDAAELALVFANRHEIVVAGKGEKLLILRGRIGNPEKTTSFSLSASDAVGFALWERYRIPGQLKHVSHFNPDTLKQLQGHLKPGESTKFVGVWRVPADWTDFRIGLYTGKPIKIAWYDLTDVIQPIRGSIFASVDGRSTIEVAKVPAGKAFDLDGLELQITGVRYDSVQRGYVMLVRVTNKGHLVPARWGWQYFGTELLSGVSGSPLRSYPDIVDERTGKSWGGDLPAEATMQARFLFPASDAGGIASGLLRITVNATGRVVEAAF
ncbi:hypothetical protein F183_A10680 [Bryobacterales bacterium F-183]|nr:hypothetical protein F183_A10680 [Bryobacterales bacterium F-183]